MELEAEKKKLAVVFLVFTVFISGIGAWTGEIHGRVICDVCGDSALGPEDHILQGPLFLSSLQSTFNFMILMLTIKNLSWFLALDCDFYGLGVIIFIQ